MNVMQFRSYLFPHNPASIQVSEGVRTACLFRPGQGEALQTLGPKLKTVICRGSFFGDSSQDAFAQLEEFRKAAPLGVAGSLFLPGLDPFTACLTQLELAAQGEGRILPYTMVFTEVMA